MTNHPVHMLPRLSPERLSEIDRDLLDQSGFLHLFPAEKYDSMLWPELRVWLHERAIYGLPTENHPHAVFLSRHSQPKRKEHRLCLGERVSSWQNAGINRKAQHEHRSNHPSNHPLFSC